MKDNQKFDEDDRLELTAPLTKQESRKNLIVMWIIWLPVVLGVAVIIWALIIISLEQHYT